MNRVSLFVGAAALTLMTACGGGGGGGSNTPTSSSAASEASSTAVSQSSVSSVASSASSVSSVASSISSAASSTSANSATLTKAKKDLAAFGAFDMLSAMGSVTTAAGGAAPSLRIDYSAYVCPNGGTADISANGMSYSNCVNGNIKQNGSITYTNVSATATSVSGTYKFNNYMVEVGDESSLMNATIALTATLSNYALSSYDATINGSFEYEEPGHTAQVTLSNYKVKFTNNTFTLSGTVTVNNNPDPCGTNGTYTFQTISPLTYGVDGRINGGTLRVGNTDYKFNSNGTVTVDGQTYTLEELENSCV